MKFKDIPDKMKNIDEPVYRASEMTADKSSDDKVIIVGQPAVYSQTTNIGDLFFERIEPGAFDGCDFDDVPFFINHKRDEIPTARSRRNNKKSTMQLEVDNTGLKITAIVNLKNQRSAELYSSIEDGNIDGMSFAFRVKEERWENLNSDMPSRYITKIAKVFEVSAVNFAAYKGTSINARGESPLENDEKALDNARATLRASLENEQSETEKLKIKIKINGGLL